MTKTSDTEVSAESHFKEWIDKLVVDTFNELLIEIGTDIILHPSEQVNRIKAAPDFLDLIIYDIINFYHGFCKLCEQHFYSRTLACDVNSFFQNHLNTAYHRQIRAVCSLPDTTPLFTWESEFQSARCNLCEMSNITPYVIDTDFEIMTLMKSHLCFWDPENRHTNKRALKKFNLLRKFARLKIFRRKFITTIRNNTVCLLCMTKIPWSGEKACRHLVSDVHYHSFCKYLRIRFGFFPKDVLNGFNLETITRSLITENIPIPVEFTDLNEEKTCLEHSNIDKNPYSEEKNNFSFSPKLYKKLVAEENDFKHNNKCLLCNTAFEPRHITSELHRSKARGINIKSFDEPEKYSIFLLNKEKRLRMIGKYEKLKTKLDNSASQKNVIKKSPHEKHFKTMFDMKLNLVKAIFAVKSEKKVFCQVCDCFVPTNDEISHLTCNAHKAAEDKWKILEANFQNERFFEPFTRVKALIICLVCGSSFDQNSFFSHLKGGMHLRRFEWYCNQNDKTPISAAFTFSQNFVCSCNLCDTPLNNKGASIFAIKTALRRVFEHWPCPIKNKKETDLSQELSMIFKTNETVVQKNLNLVQDMAVLCSTCGRPFKKFEMKSHSKSCAKNSVDFKKVEKTVGNFVNVFEKKIMDNVLDKTTLLLSSLNSLSITPTTNEIKKGLDKGETSHDVKDPVKEGNQISLKKKKQVEEKRVKILKNESRSQKTDNNVNQKLQVCKNVEKINLGEEHEALMIEGLARRQRRYNVIYEKFSTLGKIRFVYFIKKKIIVAFENGNTAEMAAKILDLYKNTISVKITSRKHLEQSIKLAKLGVSKLRVEKLPSLNQSIVSLLEDPQVLMNFILQAIPATESPIEMKREELVCATIISAVSQDFPLSRCYPFGSRLSGLTLNNSDLDVFLDCGGMYEGFKNTSPACEIKLVKQVANLLKKKKEITKMTVVSRARVPIVSFFHTPTNMRCDVSFKNGLGVQNTLLIKFLISLDWRVRPLILFLKHWAKVNGLHGPPYFSSYALAMLVVYYLEQLEYPVLPTIESLQNSYVGKRTTIGGWDCSINLNKSIIPKSENKDPFSRLLADLFQFYSTFDYEKNVISPLSGKLLSREAFSSAGIEKLPFCYKRHILNIPTPIENLVNNKISICIIDPFDLSHVLTKSFSLGDLTTFIQLCRISAKILNDSITDTVPLEEQ